MRLGTGALATGMAWGLETDPVTIVVLAFLVVFSVVNWLRWRSTEAWFHRVLVERTETEDDDRDPPGGA